MKTEVLEAIKVLIDEGYIILQVQQPDENDLYLAIYSWQESYFNSTSSVDFNTLEGVDITNFIVNQSSQARNRQHFLALFGDVFDKERVIILQFSKNIPWTKWQNSGRKH